MEKPRITITNSLSLILKHTQDVQGSQKIENNQLFLNRQSVKFVRMTEPTTIYDLPEEVLLEIFQLLDGKSLQNATLTCKNWNKSIGSSVKTMKKFKLVIGLKNFQDQSEENETSYNRKHFNLEIHMIGSSRTLEVIYNFNIANIINLSSSENYFGSH
jgi:F-box-like